jgi:hypothetical protein
MGFSAFGDLAPLPDPCHCPSWTVGSGPGSTKWWLNSFSLAWWLSISPGGWLRHALYHPRAEPARGPFLRETDGDCRLSGDHAVMVTGVPRAPGEWGSMKHSEVLHVGE